MQSEKNELSIDLIMLTPVCIVKNLKKLFNIINNHIVYTHRRVHILVLIQNYLNFYPLFYIAVVLTNINKLTKTEVHFTYILIKLFSSSHSFYRPII